jgi:hypothetical protein
MLRKNADVIELFASSEIRGVESGKCGVAHRAKASRHNQPNSKHGDLLQGRKHRTRATSRIKATNLSTIGSSASGIQARWTRTQAFGSSIGLKMTPGKIVSN